jgi:hypothetical protein
MEFVYAQSDGRPADRNSGLVIASSGGRLSSVVLYLARESFACLSSLVG